ncbi:MAG: hypothetical protein Q4C30_06085 [Bacteroidia bacterium]|nr:hypothetical protein [Bacteroidia bacterium]
MSKNVVTEIKEDSKQQLNLLQWAEDGAIIFVKTSPEDKLISRLCTIIENEGLHILSVGSRMTDDGYIEVFTKISTHNSLYATMALKRHGFNAWTDNQEAMLLIEDNMYRNYEQLMSYIAN